MRLLSSYLIILLLTISSKSVFAQFDFTKSIIDTAFITNWPTNVRSADFDLNGTIDLVVTVPDFSGEADRIYIYKNNGDNTFIRSILDSTIFDPGRIVVADIDGNDYPDFVVASGDGLIRYSTSDGFNSWTKSTIDDGLVSYRLPLIADLDKDMDTDIVFLANQGIYWAENDGAEFFNVRDIEIIDITDNALQVYDVDIDGDNDVISANFPGATESAFGWYENDGAENFTFNEIVTIDNNFMELVVDDLDDDGDIDFLTCETRDPNLLHAVYWYKNDGSQNFTKNTVGLDFEIYPRDLAVLDFDYDGDKDIMVTGGNSANGELVIYKNDGIENFSKIPLDESPGNRENLELVDADLDGDQDVFVMNSWPFQLEYFENNTPTLEQRDSLALVTFYNSTNGDSWTNNTGWLTDPIDDWFGITVVDKRVVDISLFNNNLTGTIPPEIGNLTELTNLYLSGNDIDGSIPAEIGNLLNLTSLNIGSNNLSGELPAEIGQLENLLSIIIPNGNLTGSIPQSFANLTNLRDLALFNNNLSGPIPTGIGALPDLLQLRIQQNQFTGNIPADIFNSTTIWELNLERNQLSGTIPPEIGNMTALVNLFLEFNQLTGSIPSEIGNLNNLIFLTAYENNLTGSIPPEIGQLSSLQTLHLGDNNLTGTIPAEIGDLSDLDFLSLRGNELTGEIPASIGQLVKLINLELYDNDLSGPIPSTIGNLIDLRWLRLYENQLDGSIPAEIGNLETLEVIDMQTNKFTGDFPSSAAALSNLLHIYLQNNQLSGLPDLSGITGLNNLIVYNNRLTFEDIEPNLGFVTLSFFYNPQAKVGQPVDTAVSEGSNLQLIVEVGGLNNQYQWFKGTSELAGQTSNQLDLFSVDIDDEGVYYCQITNTAAVDLTLESEPVTVIVQGLPIITPDVVSNISLNSARLNGIVNPRGLSTAVDFKWGLERTLSTATSIAADQSPITSESVVNTTLSGLISDSRYYYQILATNSFGTQTSMIDSFRTLSEGDPPAVETLNPTNITAASAQLNGSVNANDLESTVEFEVEGFTTIAAEQSPIVGTVNQNVDATVSGLLAETQYQVRVIASNSAGTSFGDWLNFTTLASGSGITAVTLAPENVNSDGATLKGSINPGNLNVTSHFQWGIDQSYGFIVATDQGQLSGNSDIIVTANIASLNENSIHHYRVIAVNGADTTFGLNQQFNTLYGPVALNSPADGSTGMTISGTLDWIAAPDVAQYQIQVATDNSFSNLVVNETVSQISHDVLLSFATTYYWRVAVYKDGIIHSWSDAWSLSTETFPAEVPVTTMLNFPQKSNSSDYLATDYRLFGLPGNANISLTDILGSNNNDEWIAYWDNGQTGNPDDYLEAYTNNNTFRFTTGRAFWVIYKGSHQINETIDNTSISSGNDISIPVHTGWNIISNPLPNTVDWNIVQAHNGISEPIHGFEGSFNTTSNMETYKGYYFFNDPGLSKNTILIPITSSFGKFAKVSEPGEKLIWNTDVEIKTNDAIRSSVEIGVSELATNDKDILDYHKPRAIGEIPGAYFERFEWDENYPFFANDIKAPFDEMASWLFKVNAGKRETIELTVPDINRIPQEFEVYLIDHTREKFINLRDNSPYNFKGIPNISSFELLVGNENNVNEKLQNILPKTFSVGASFPNPFNPTTTIPVSVPETTTITITIFDVLGRAVKNLHKGKIEAGKHFFSWNGTNENGHKQSSGIYLFKITDDTGKAHSGKLILLK